MWRAQFHEIVFPHITYYVNWVHPSLRKVIETVILHVPPSTNVVLDTSRHYSSNRSQFTRWVSYVIPWVAQGYLTVQKRYVNKTYASPFYRCFVQCIVILEHILGSKQPFSYCLQYRQSLFSSHGAAWVPDRLHLLSEKDIRR